MKQYLAQLTEILKDGEIRTDRTGVGTKSIFGMQTRYNLRDGFPAVTTKKLAWRSVVSELLWFLEGSTDERRLAEILYGSRDPAKSTIWSANALNQGVALGYTYNDTQRQLGPIYGAQWRDWGSDASRSGEHTDQITALIQQIRHQPHSRRHILTAWNVGDVPDMALPPCHVMAQFYVSNNDELSCQLYQRSADMFLGVPFNIASYALLTHMIAQLTGLKVGDFVHSTGDTHIYLNHIDQVKLQLERPPMELPNIIMPSFTTLDELTALPVDAFKLMGYNPGATITAPMAV
jgi:thymidylate synthase